MDQQTAIDFIRDQHIHKLEKKKRFYMLRNMMTGLGVQDLSKLMLNSVLNDTIEMVADFDELENKLKDSWQNK